MQSVKFIFNFAYCVLCVVLANALHSYKCREVERVCSHNCTKDPKTTIKLMNSERATRLTDKQKNSTYTASVLDYLYDNILCVSTQCQYLYTVYKFLDRYRNISCMFQYTFSFPPIFTDNYPLIKI